MSPQESKLNPDPQEVQAKKIAKEEKKEALKQSQKSEVTPAPQVLVSHTDAYIYDRLKGQPQSLQEVEQEIVVKKKEGIHQLSLPKELDEFQERFAFYWIYKNKKAIDRACDVRGWKLVSRVYFPDLPTYLFTINGVIERGDNILGFMPKKQAEELRQAPGRLSSEIVKSQFDKHKGDPRYYAPKDEESKSVVMI